MNWARSKISALEFLSIFQMLIVLAIFCAAEFSQAALKKNQQTPVDNGAEQLTGEHLLYSKVIDSYRLKNLSELSRASELMIKAYPHSVHTDDALYLKADLLLAKGQYQNGLEVLELLLKNYPDSNKRVSALFLKAEALEKTKQNKGADEARNEIQLRYPGSIEAAKIYSQKALQQ